MSILAPFPMHDPDTRKIPKVACAITHVQIPTEVDANKSSQAWKLEK